MIIDVRIQSEDETIGSYIEELLKELAEHDEITEFEIKEVLDE